MDRVNYELVPIKRIGKVITGKTPATSHEEYYGGQYMFISPVELHGGYRVTKSEKTITEKGLESIKTNSIEGISVLVGCIGWDMGNVAMCFEKCATNQQINAITQIDAKYNPYYIYYWLCGKKKYLFSIASVTRTPILSKSTFEEIVIPLPIKKNQDKIANILLKIDQKITLNKQINDNLEQQMHLIFENMMAKAATHKLSGEYTIAQNLATVVTGKEDANFSVPNGKYKFFTCSNTPLLCDEYVFDSSSILIAGNGDFNVKHYSGKFNAYQRTYVLTPDKKYFGLLYLASLYRINSFKSRSSGSIVKFITKSDVENIPIFIPNNMFYLQELNKLIYLQEQNKLENELLVNLRDWLLPMLMNGQATISD